MSSKVPWQAALLPALFPIVALIILAAVFMPLSASAEDGDAITGLWEVADGGGRIEIVRCGGHYCGDLVWVREPLYPPDDSRGMGGRPLVDRENPKKELRGLPQLGLRIMEKYTYRGNDFWDDGTIYNTENGRTYRSNITLLSHDRLELRGFIGIPLLGGSTIWKRVK